jgi:hypothetical protein
LNDGFSFLALRARIVIIAKLMSEFNLWLPLASERRVLFLLDKVAGDAATPEEIFDVNCSVNSLGVGWWVLWNKIP